MSNCCTICVRGYPSYLPPERVVDKLAIHFLRKRNGGGEIVNIEFAPEFPDCAIITFEDASVAQRVLEAKHHVLSINEKTYPLEVAAHTSELNPDEIFVRVYMKIDYGSIPSGKDILCNLCKQYGDIQLHFSSQDLTCSVKGSFTELQAFSSELLRHLKSQQRRCVPAVDGKGSLDKAASNGVLNPPEIQAEERTEKATAASPLTKNSVESHAELLEDFSLVIDSDVYLYMQTFCAEEFRNILRQYQTGLVDVSSDGVTTLYLRSATEEAGSVRALVSTYLALSQLSQQLESTLQKEKINKGDLGGGGTRELQGLLQNLCPLLLTHEADEHLYLIGSSVEVSRAKQYIQGRRAARAATLNGQKPDVPQSTHVSSVPGQSSILAQPTLLAESVAKKKSSPRSSSKSEHKLAATFSTKNSFLSPHASVGGPCPGSSLQTAEHQPPNREHSLQFLATAAGSGDLLEQPVTAQKVPQADAVVSLAEDKASVSEDQMSLDHMKPPLLRTASSPMRSSDLFDSTRTVGFKPAEPRPPLRRPNSVIFQKPQNSGTSVTEPAPAMDRLKQDTQSWSSSTDHLKQDTQEDNHLALQKEIQDEGMIQMDKERKMESPIARQGFYSLPLLATQREDEGPSDLQRAETSPVPPSYITETFSYSELAMEGPEDEALTQLCSLMKKCHDQVIISRDKYQVSFAYPHEAALKVLETFHHFSAQRVVTLTEQLFSHGAQQGSIQDKWSNAEAERLKDIIRADLRQNPVDLGGLAGEEMSSQAQSSPDAKSSLPAEAQNIPRNQNTSQNENLNNASKQNLAGKSVPEWPPEKFHFLKDSRVEKNSHEVERAAWSLPPLPLDFSVPALKQTADRQSASAKEGIIADMDLKPTGLRRMSSAEGRELFRSTDADMLSTLKVRKTPISTDSHSPPSSNASPAIPGSFGASTLSQSLPGYFRDPTLKITYDIPDGMQQAGNPHPGHPYRGGRFEAFLPDNVKGRRLMVLLRKAFERGLTFQIQSSSSLDRVVWGPIPHKTSMEGGKARNGYPDIQYLQHLSLMLKALNIE